MRSTRTSPCCRGPAIGQDLVCWPLRPLSWMTKMTKCRRCRGSHAAPNTIHAFLCPSDGHLPCHRGRLSQSEASCGSRDISPTNGRPRHTRDTPHHVTCSLSITSRRTKKIGYIGNMHLLMYLHTVAVRSEFCDRHRTRYG